MNMNAVSTSGRPWSLGTDSNLPAAARKAAALVSANSFSAGDSVVFGLANAITTLLLHGVFCKTRRVLLVIIEW